MAMGAQNLNVNRGILEDSSSPYFLQNGDHPGLIPVSHSLIGSNYNTWNRAMFMDFTAKNKVGFVDGTFFNLEMSIRYTVPGRDVTVW